MSLTFNRNCISKCLGNILYRFFVSTSPPALKSLSTGAEDGSRVLVLMNRSLKWSTLHKSSSFFMLDDLYWFSKSMALVASLSSAEKNPFHSPGEGWCCSFLADDVADDVADSSIRCSSSHSMSCSASNSLTRSSLMIT